MASKGQDYGARDSRDLLENKRKKRDKEIQEDLDDFISTLSTCKTMSEMLDRAQLLFRMEAREKYKYRDEAYELREAKTIIAIEKELEREKFIRSHALRSFRLYLEQLEREFREGSQAPDNEQMIKDLKSKGEVIPHTNLSNRYIEWLWFLKCSSYWVAVNLRRMVRKNFDKLSDFVEVLSKVWGDASDETYHRLDPLNAEEIKRGLKFHRLDSKSLNLAVDLMYQLKKISPKNKRKRPRVNLTNKDIDDSSSSAGSAGTKVDDSSSSAGTKVDDSSSSSRPKRMFYCTRLTC